MELFDTQFVWFGQVLPVSGMKLLATSNRYIGKVTTIPIDSFWNTYIFQNENKHQIMNVHTKWNCLIPILSGLVKYCLFQG